MISTLVVDRDRFPRSLPAPSFDIGRRTVENLGHFGHGEIFQRHQQQRLAIGRRDVGKAFLRSGFVQAKITGAGMVHRVHERARPHLVEGPVQRHAAFADGTAQFGIGKSRFQRGAHKGIAGLLAAGQGRA
jgi:hypothetical protein